MKVLKQGQVDWSVERNCLSCHAVLEVRAEDVHYQVYIGDCLYYFYCPECGIVNRLTPEDELPIHVRRAAEKLGK